MVLCREGHPTAKPASEPGISARMAANAHSAGLPGQPPSIRRQADTLLPSTEHEAGQQCSKAESRTSQPWRFQASPSPRTSALSYGPQRFHSANGGRGGLDWKMTKDTRSCKPTTDGHFPSFGRESKIVAHFLEGSDIHIL